MDNVFEWELLLICDKQAFSIYMHYTATESDRLVLMA